MTFFKIIFNRAFAKHLGIAVLVGILVILLTFWVLNLYTRHGKGFAAPDFTGLTEQQLEHLIQENELRYAIIDSAHINELPPGVVIEQTPKAGSMVKKNRNIFFTINAWTPEKVQVPDVIDYSIRNARVMLESFGLEVGKLIYVPSEYTNLVLGQHYKGKPVEAGTPLERGAVIDLIVGQGLSNRTTAVPDLKGLYYDEAKQISQDLSLNIGAQIFDSTIVSREDTLKAFVWKQRPSGSGDSRLRLGSSIDIWLTVDSSYIMSDTSKVDTAETPEQEFSEEPVEEEDLNEEEFF
ncbi:PASTA domain-containing protein [Marinilabilia sp.]|uniref:PASTA domain-containing protein n=1 Tax=Marinilabilia sp. TaxID=2021252 RepID=UPI0025C3D2C2|nr:PASTA domain-containing protein [Marinilabilia sp.]